MAKVDSLPMTNVLVKDMDRMYRLLNCALEYYDADDGLDNAKTLTRMVRNDLKAYMRSKVGNRGQAIEARVKDPHPAFDCLAATQS